jgi:hypothetical protein
MRNAGSPLGPVGCEALHSAKETYALAVFESAFKEFGLPHAIRTDNGVPFANTPSSISQSSPSGG